MRIAFIGSGVMAEAMIRGILSQGLTKPEMVTASDINPGRCHILAERFGVKTATDNRNALENDQILVLSIKPQTLDQVMAELEGHLEPQQLVLSIVAGASINTISQGLKHNTIARVMPNMPAQIGEGVSVWTTSNAVSQAQKEAVRTILATLGNEIYVSSEKYLDMATAVSGSGPAYILLIIESLIEAAVHIGLARDMARELVLQTVLGTTRFAQETDKHPAELRNMVTSPGGTTAEGLLQLEESGLRGIIAQAVIAAYEKAKTLGGEKK